MEEITYRTNRQILEDIEKKIKTLTKRIDKLEKQITENKGNV